VARAHTTAITSQSRIIGSSGESVGEIEVIGVSE
jgi:hypothetical protein